MNWFNDKEKRGYIGSWAFILMVFIIIGFLSFQEVPEANKDIITAIVGMLVASLGMVVYTLIGKDDNEVKELRQSNEILQEQNKQLKKQVDNLQEMFMTLQTDVIGKLSILASNDKNGN